MSHMGNPHQSRIGAVRTEGAAFPKTAAGDEVLIFASPGHWANVENPGVHLVINETVAVLSSQEARNLASQLVDHANTADEQEGHR